MKLTRSVLGFVFASAVIAAPAPVVVSAQSAQQPDCTYPIGRGGANAKTAGRLFDIDGRVEYFAGTELRIAF